MAVLRNTDGTQLLIDCLCGCDEGIRFRIDKDDFDYYCFMTYTNGCFYGDQECGVFRALQKKLKKIWAIIKNEDYYYSEIMMTKDEFDEFKKYINSIER